MVLAGVDSGAKILVRPVEELAVWAAALARKQKKNASIGSAFTMIEFLVRRIFDRSLLFEFQVFDQM
jgi:hypothetical protein